ncbi:MAG: head decoration protein [Halorhodospira sp.]
MTKLTEGQHNSEFLIAEANGHISREAVTIASGEELEPGHVLGRVSDSDEYKVYNPSNDDGSEEAVAVCCGHVDASDESVSGVPIIARHAEVNAEELVWFDDATDDEKKTGISELAEKSGIIAR